MQRLVQDTGFGVVAAVAKGALPPHGPVRVDGPHATAGVYAIADGKRFPVISRVTEIPAGALDRLAHKIQSDYLQCSCGGGLGGPCKGMWAAAIQAIAGPVQAAPVTQLMVADLTQPCPKGHPGSVCRGGVTHTEWGDNQRFLCQSGRHRYNHKGLLSYRLLAPDKAALALGRVLRTGRIQETVDEMRLAANQAIGRQFLREATAEVLAGFRQIAALHAFTPSGIWLADETQLPSLRGKPWVCTVEDAGSRMVLHAGAAATSNRQALQSALRQAVGLGGRPRILLTDGHAGYRQAMADLGVRCLHLEAHNRTRTSDQGQLFWFNGLTNRVERSHQTLKHLLLGRAGLRDLEGLRRQLEQAVAFYNFLRPSQALGKTPVEAAGLVLQAPASWTHYQKVFEYALHVMHCGSHGVARSLLRPEPRQQTLAI